MLKTQDSFPHAFQTFVQSCGQSFIARAPLCMRQKDWQLPSYSAPAVSKCSDACSCPQLSRRRHFQTTSCHQTRCFWASLAGSDEADQEHRTVVQALPLPNNLRAWQSGRAALYSCPGNAGRNILQGLTKWTRSTAQLSKQRCSQTTSGPHKAEKEHRTVVQAPPLSDSLRA